MSDSQKASFGNLVQTLRQGVASLI